MAAEPIIDVKDMRIAYDTDLGRIEVVRGVSYQVFPNETLAIVGESGCGKSQSSYGVMGLIQPPGRVTGGEVWFRESDDAEAVDLLQYEPNSKAMRSIRGGKITMIFQEPMTAFSPVHRIGSALDEALRLHTKLDKKQRFAKACEMLTRVGIPDAEKRYCQYSFEFSGGMRQRIMIALALCCNPRLLIADEPTTGLDVTIQAQILDLIGDLQKQYEMGVIFITHDLAVVAQIADRVAVMYRGEIVECADVEAIFAEPRHPYTRALLRSVVGSPLASDGTLQVIKGSIPPPTEIIPGCPFHPRCEELLAGRCEREKPPMQARDGRLVCCHLYDHEREEA